MSGTGRRHPAEFIVWNHVFMAYEVYRAAGTDWILFVLGGVCTVLSVVRHVHRESRCCVSEPLVAKCTEIYIAIASMGLPFAQMLTLMASKALVLVVWALEDRDYERIHPWLHVLVAADAHYYLGCMG